MCIARKFLKVWPCTRWALDEHWVCIRWELDEYCSEKQPVFFAWADITKPGEHGKWIAWIHQAHLVNTTKQYIYICIFHLRIWMCCVLSFEIFNLVLFKITYCHYVVAWKQYTKQGWQIAKYCLHTSTHANLFSFFILYCTRVYITVTYMNNTSLQWHCVWHIEERAHDTLTFNNGYVFLSCVCDKEFAWSRQLWCLLYSKNVLKFVLWVMKDIDSGGHFY